MRLFTKAGECSKGKRILRLRKTIGLANCLAALRMTGLLLALLPANAGATTYYVSSSIGSDSNAGTSSSAAWQTIAHVNGRSFVPGDSILFRRGDVWNESLVTPSSGTSGNPIVFDAYGTGAAPNLTGYYSVPSSAWVLVTGNAWKAVVPATFSTINFCLFGSVWGEKVAAVSTNLSAQGNFYLANGYVYVYSQGNPAIFYNEPIVPMALSNIPVIDTNGQSWLTFQHFLINWFDQYGVYVQGTSDHLIFANMEADSMIPEGTQPLGFYVDESAPGPGDIKIYNTEAHLNYDAYRFDGAATAISMVNDKAYASRDGGLVDNTGAVTYSYCHFYASSLAIADSTDVEWTSGTGPTAGAGNIAVNTPPAVQVYQRYPAEVTLTVDDAGMTVGADSYYATQVLPVADAAGVPVGAAITVGYPLANTLISEFQGWINAGRDVTSHSMSHTYYTNTDALEIQYTGSGTAASLSIGNKVLTITVTGASDSFSYNLAQGQAEGTIGELNVALFNTGKFTTSYLTPCQGPYGTGCSAYTFAALLSQDLADVSNVDVKNSVYHVQLDVTRLTTDEITLSRHWMTTNLTGLPGTPVYVYPGGYETTTMQGITQGVPYSGARGALKEDLGVKDTYADGFNVQNITSFGVNPSWMGASGVTPAILNQKIQALVWKESVWGVPWGIFWHLNDLVQDDPVGGTEITNLINDFKNNAATIRTNTGLVNWLLSGQQETGTDGNDYYSFPATSTTLDFRPTKNSPVVDAGENLGAAYALDINGVNQNSYGSGWEIGAHVYQAYAVYGGESGGSHFTVGEGGATVASCTFAAGVLGGMEATCINPNLTTPTIMCATLDGSIPAGNGSGTGCINGFALSPVATGGVDYPGYFNFNQTSIVKVVAEVSGEPDSPAAYYDETVPTQAISAYNFAMQCGPGVSTNCPIVSGAVTWPSSTVAPKTLRLHDSGVGWSIIEPTSAGATVWTDLDAYLDALAGHPSELGMFQFVSVPCWVAPGGACDIDTLYPNGTNAPPADLGTGPMGSSPHFNGFVSALLGHTSANGNSVVNNIKVFEGWNEWNLCHYWTGNPAQLYAMLAYPVQLIRAAIPGVVIDTPSEQFTGTTCQDGYQTDLTNWLTLENTNGRISDIVDWHGYMSLTSSSDNTPETQWNTYMANYRSAQNAMAGWKVAPFLNSESSFNSGNGYVCPSSQYSETDCTGQVVRWQIMHDSNGAVGLNWYYWNTTIGQAAGSTANGYYGFSAAYSYAQQYLIGGQFTAAAAISSGTTWTAPMIEANGVAALWVWTTSETGATYSVPGGYSDYEDLNGVTHTVSAGQNIAIAVMPVMLEQGAAVTVNVTGTGSVSDSQGGIVGCTASSSPCIAHYPAGASDTLTATAGTNQVFSGWSNCIGTFPTYLQTTCTFTVTASPSQTALFTQATPIAPETYVDPNEWWYPTKQWQYEVSLLGTTWIEGPPPATSGCSINGGGGLPYATSSASPAQMSVALAQAINDAECFRANNLPSNDCTMIDYPPGFYVSSGGIVWPEDAASPASCFNGIRSTSYASLPLGQIIGSHGNMANLASTTNSVINGVSLTNVRIDNPDLTGQNMSFELGPTNGYGSGLCGTSGIICGITTVSVNTQTLCSVPNATATIICPVISTGTQVVMPLVNGYVSPTLGGVPTQVTVDVGSNQELLTPASCVNNSGMCVTFAKSHAAGACVVYNTTGCGGTGVVNTSGTTVTLTAGQRFNSDMTSITISGMAYTVASWTAPGDVVTLTSSAGSQTGVGYSATSLVGSGTGGFTLANGIATNTSAYNDLQYMGQFVCTGTNCAPVSVCSPLATGPSQCANHGLSGAAQPDHIVLQDVAAIRSTGNTGVNSLFNFGEAGTETSTAQLCSHVHFRQDSGMGDWTSLLVGANASPNVFQLGCIYDSLLDSAATQSIDPSVENHAVGAGWGSERNISHNYFYCCSSSTFAGGSGSTLPITSPAAYVINTDGEYRRNVERYPYSWLGYGEVPGYNAGGNYFWPNNFTQERKNCFEQKSGLRLIIDGNDCGATDTSGGQFAAGVSLGTRNVSTGFGGQNYNTQMTDVTISNMRISDTSYAFDSDRSATASGGGGTAYPARRMSYNNILVTGLQTNVPATIGGHTDIFEPNEAWQQWQGNVSCSGGSCQIVGICNADVGNFTIGTDSSSSSPLVFPSECPGQIGQLAWTSGSACTAGTITFTSPGVEGAATGSASYTCTGTSINTVTLLSSGSLYATAPAIAANTGTCTGCTFTTTLVTSPVTPVSGVQVADISAGDPVAIWGCTSLTGLNVPMVLAGDFYWPGAIGPRASMGSTPWNGTFNPGNLTVSFPAPLQSGGVQCAESSSGCTPVAGTDNAGFCSFSNIQGGPQNVQLNHMTAISNNTYGINAISNVANSYGGGPQYMMNASFTNNIITTATNACVGNSNLGHGSFPQNFWTDFNTTNWAYNVCIAPSGTAPLYTEVDNDTAYPITGCAIALGCVPPNTWYFPTATSAIDFVNSSANSGALTLPDYHGYELSSSSPFAGGSSQINGVSGPASDGTAMGANISAIDAAQMLNQYPGAFPEVPVSGPPEP